MAGKETILAFLLREEYKHKVKKLGELIAIGAPKLLVQSVYAEIEQIAEGNLGKVGGDNSLLGEEFESMELKSHSQFGYYYSFDNEIYYYPYAKYGQFIVKRERKI